jgi:hypothetical protein
MTVWLKSLMAVVLSGLLTDPLAAQETVWTAVIPQGFPRNIYTWHLKAIGAYSEDGRDALSGAPVQSTLTGHWRRAGGHMMLQQDGIDYRFEGDIVGDEYLGVVYLDGKRFSRFCALRGKMPPRTCATVSA